MRTWAPILHFYQPPTQAPGLTEWIKKTCYTPLVELLLRNPKLELTINFAGSLALELEKLSSTELFTNLNTLWKRGQIEFLHSPLYHPLGPLTSIEVIKRQTAENTSVIERLIGAKMVDGFFPPELAISSEFLTAMGNDFKFIICDESSVNSEFSLNKIPDTSVFSFDSTSLVVASRALTEVLRSYPGELTASMVTRFLGEKTKEGDFIVSLSDAEVFGHHYSERLQLLGDLTKQTDIVISKISTALEGTKPQALSKEKIVSSTWQTAKQDLTANCPFPLWDNAANELQQSYLLLANIAHEALVKSPDDNGEITTTAMHHFDRGISSCHLFWLSHNPWWHPDLAEAGATELIKSIRTLPVSGELKKEAETLYHLLLLQIWQLHWSGQTGKYFQDYDKQREDLIKDLPKLS